MKNENVKKTLAGVSAVVMASSMVAVPASAIDADSISINFDGSDAGESKSVLENVGTVELTPDYGAGTLASTQSVVWESSDPEVATVSDGVVEVKKQGNVTITAKLITTETSAVVASDTLALTVKDVATYSMEVNGGNTYAYKVSYADFTSSSSSGYGYTDNGVSLVEAKLAGTNMAPVFTSEGGNNIQSGEYDVTVTYKSESSTATAKVYEVTLAPKNSAFTLGATNTPLTVTVTTAAVVSIASTPVAPIEVEYGASDDVKIKEAEKKVLDSFTVMNGGTPLTADDYTAVVNGKSTIAEGVVNVGVKVTLKDTSAYVFAAGAEEATFSTSVTVNEKADPTLGDVTITNGAADAILFENGEDSTLTLTATQKGEAYKDATFTWSSSDSSIASVDENGKVTAHMQGTATIKALSNKGENKYKEYTITVRDVATYDITANNKHTVEYSVATGKLATLTAKDVETYLKTLNLKADFTSLGQHNISSTDYEIAVSKPDTSVAGKKVFTVSLVATKDKVTGVDNVRFTTGSNTDLTVTVTEAALPVAEVSLSAPTADAKYTIFSTEDTVKAAAKAAVDALYTAKDKTAGAVFTGADGVTLVEGADKDYTVTVGAATAVTGKVPYGATESNKLFESVKVPVTVALTETGKAKVTFKDGEKTDATSITLDVTVALTRENVKVQPTWKPKTDAINVKVAYGSEAKDKVLAANAAITAEKTITDYGVTGYNYSTDGGKTFGEAFTNTDPLDFFTVTAAMKGDNTAVFTVSLTDKAEGVELATDDTHAAAKEVAVTYTEAEISIGNVQIIFDEEVVKDNTLTVEYSAKETKTAAELEAKAMEALENSVTVKYTANSGASYVVLPGDFYELEYAKSNATGVYGANTTITAKFATDTSLTEAATGKYNTTYMGNDVSKAVTIKYKNTDVKTSVVPVISGEDDGSHIVKITTDDTYDTTKAKVLKYVEDNKLMVLSGVDDMTTDDYTYVVTYDASGNVTATFTIKNTTDFTIDMDAALAADDSITINSAGTTITKKIKVATTTEKSEISPKITYKAPEKDAEGVVIDSDLKKALNLKYDAATNTVSFDFVADEDASLEDVTNEDPSQTVLGLKSTIANIANKLYKIDGVADSYITITSLNAKGMTVDQFADPMTATGKISFALNNNGKLIYTLGEDTVTTINFKVNFVAKKTITGTYGAATAVIPTSMFDVEKNNLKGDIKSEFLTAEVLEIAETTAKNAFTELEDLTEGEDYSLTFELKEVSQTGSGDDATATLKYDITVKILNTDAYMFAGDKTEMKFEGKTVVLSNPKLANNVTVTPVLSIKGDNFANNTLTVNVLKGSTAAEKKAAAEAALKEITSAVFYNGTDGKKAPEVNSNLVADKDYKITATIDDSKLVYTMSVSVALTTAAANDYTLSVDELTWTPDGGTEQKLTAAQEITGIKIKFVEAAEVKATAGTVEAVEVKNGATDAEKIAAAEKAALAAISVKNAEVPLTADDFTAVVDGKSAIADGVVTVNVKVTVADASKYLFKDADGKAVEEAIVAVSVTVNEADPAAVVTAAAAKVDAIEVENGTADADKIAAAEKAALAAISVKNGEEALAADAYTAVVDGKSAIADGVVTVSVKVTLKDTTAYVFADDAAEATVEVKVTVTEKEAPVVDTTPELTLTTGTDSVKVTWEAVPGADKYAIYGFNSDGLFLGEEVTGTTYTASNLTEGGYGFVVVSCINGEWDYNWTADDIVYTLIKPANTNPVLKVTPGVKSATVSWDAVPGAGMYWLYVFGDNGLVYETLVTGTSTTVTGLEEGKGYAFAAISYFESGWDYNYTADDLVYTFIQPEDAIPNLMVTPAAGGATVSWEAIPGADLYWLYVFGSNGLVDQMPVDGTSTTVTGLTTGEGYAFVGVSYINGAWNFNWTAEDLVYTIAG